MAKIKNNIKLDRYPKFIFTDGNNVYAEKRYFQNIYNKYSLDKNNNLCIKFFIKSDKENNVLNFKNKRKRYKKYKLMRVPFVKDLYTFLRQIHSESVHRGKEALKKELIIRNYFYKGIIEDTKLVINKSGICKIKKNNIILYKNEHFKLIVFERPNDIYIGNLTSVPIKLINNQDNIYYEENIKYKYIISIVDHFSKF